MDSNLSYFNLPVSFYSPITTSTYNAGNLQNSVLIRVLRTPLFILQFVDSQDWKDCECDDLHPTLSPGSLLGAGDDVLAQFLSGYPLEEPDLNGPTTLHCEICTKHFDNAKKYYGHLRVHSKDNLWKCGGYSLIYL